MARAMRSAGAFNGGAGVASYGEEVAAAAHLFNHGVDGGGQYVGGGGMVEVDPAVLGLVSRRLMLPPAGLSSAVFSPVYFIALYPHPSRHVHLGRVGERYSPGTSRWPGCAAFTLGTFKILSIPLRFPAIPATLSVWRRLLALSYTWWLLALTLMMRRGSDYHDLAVVTVHETL